jgi:hypothetical protein
MTLLLWARFVMLLALVAVVACYVWADAAGDA